MLKLMLFHGIFGSIHEFLYKLNRFLHYKYELCLRSKALRREIMVRKKLFLTLLMLFVLMSAIGCGKNGGTPEYSLSIAANPEGSGQVITEPSGPRYKKGTTVSLTAAPNTD